MTWMTDLDLDAATEFLQCNLRLSLRPTSRHPRQAVTREIAHLPCDCLQPTILNSRRILDVHNLCHPSYHIQVHPWEPTSGANEETYPHLRDGQSTSMLQQNSSRVICIYRVIQNECLFSNML